MRLINKRIRRKPIAIIATAIMLSVSIVAVTRIAIATPKATLKKFYTAMYVTSDLGKMESCMADDYRFYFEQAVTMAGLMPKFYQSYQSEAERLLGGNIGIDVTITKTDTVNDVRLAQIRENGTLGAVKTFTYDVRLTGDHGSRVYSNTLDMVRERGKWLMTTHLNLPIGKNVRAY